MPETAREEERAATEFDRDHEVVSRALREWQSGLVDFLLELDRRDAAREEMA